MSNVKRNPFARHEYIRKAIPDKGERCRECGRSSYRRHPLYEFRWESDGGRQATMPNVYCSWGCFKTYMNIDEL